MLAICVPSREHVHTAFAACLANLTAHLSEKNVKHTLLMLQGSLLPDQRETLVKQAMQLEATEILWLDSDMIFPRDIYHRLHKHKKDIIACNYATKEKIPKSVAFLDENDSNNRLYKGKGLTEVVAVGMGLMLVQMSVYKDVPQPWFNFFWDNVHERHTGEDIYFAEKVRSLDYKIYVDNDITSKISHLGTRGYTL